LLTLSVVRRTDKAFVARKCNENRRLTAWAWCPAFWAKTKGVSGGTTGL